MTIHSGTLYLFSIIGLLDTIYLSYHVITKTDVACWFFPKRWCRKVQHSKFSKTFGIPNPYLGLLMYVAILFLIDTTGAAPSWILPTVITFGFGFSMYFIYIQSFILNAFCTWCVLSAINFTVMFASLWL